MVRVSDRPQGLKGRDGVSDREDRSSSRVFKRAAAVAAMVLATLAPAQAMGHTMVGGVFLQPRATAVDSEQTARNNVNDYFQNGFGHDRMSESGIVQLRTNMSASGQNQQTFLGPMNEVALGLFVLSERSQGLNTQPNSQARAVQNIFTQLNEQEKSELRDIVGRYSHMTAVEKIIALRQSRAYAHLTQLIETQLYGRTTPTGIINISGGTDDLSTINTAITQMRTAALPPTRGTMFAFGGDAEVAQAQPTAPQTPVVAAQINQERVNARNRAIEDLETRQREIEEMRRTNPQVGSRTLVIITGLIRELRENISQDPNGTARVNPESDPLTRARFALDNSNSALTRGTADARREYQASLSAQQRADADRVRREEAARVAEQRARERADEARAAQAQAAINRAAAQRQAAEQAQQVRTAAVAERRQNRDNAVSTLDEFITNVNASTLPTGEKTRLTNAATALRRQVLALNPNNAFTSAQQALIANANNAGSQSTTGLRGQFNTAVAQATAQGAQVSAPATTVAFTAAQRRAFVLEELQMLSTARTVAGMNATQVTAMKREAARLRAAVLRPRSTEAQVSAAETFLQNNFVAYRAVVFQRRLARAARDNLLEVGRSAVAARNGRRAVTAIAPAPEITAVRELVNGLQGENLVDRARLAVRSFYVGSNLTTDQRTVGTVAQISGPMNQMHEAIRSGNVEEAARIYRAEQDNSRARLQQVRESLRAERARLRALIPSGVRVRETNGRMAAITLARGQVTAIPTDAQLRSARTNMGRSWRSTVIVAQTPGLESVYNYLGTLDGRVSGYIETTRTTGPRARRTTTRIPNEELSARAVLAAERNVVVALEGIGAAQNGFSYARSNIIPTNVAGRNTRTVPNPQYYRVMGASAVILRQVVNPNWTANFAPGQNGAEVRGVDTLTPNRTTAQDPRGVRFAETVVRRNEAGIHGMQVFNGSSYMVLPGTVAALATEVVAATQTSTLAPADRERREKLANVSATRFAADQFGRAFAHAERGTSGGETDTQTSARMALLGQVLRVLEGAETPEMTQMIHLAQSWREQNAGLTTTEVAQRAMNIDAIVYCLPRIQELRLRLDTLGQNAPGRAEAEEAFRSASEEFNRTFGTRLTPNDAPIVRADALRLSGQIAERALRNLDPEYWTLTTPRTDITIATVGSNLATTRERRRATEYSGTSVPTQDTPLTLADQQAIVRANLSRTINGYGGFLANPNATIPEFTQITTALSESRFVAAVALDNRRGEGYYTRREANPEEVVNRGIGRVGTPVGRASLTEAEIARQRGELARGGTTAIVTQVLRPDPLTLEAVDAARQAEFTAQERNAVSIRDARVVGDVLQSTMGNLGDIATYARAHRNDANLSDAVTPLIEPVRRALRENNPEAARWNEGQIRRYIISSLRVIGEAQDTGELYRRLMPQYANATTPIVGGFELLPFELRQRCERANLEIGRIPQVVIDQLRTLTVAPVAATSTAITSNVTISDPIYLESANRVRFEVTVNEQRQYFVDNRVEVDAVAFVNVGSRGREEIFVRNPNNPSGFIGMLVRNARVTNRNGNAESADVVVPVREENGRFVPSVDLRNLRSDNVLMYVQRGQFTPDVTTQERADAFNTNRDNITYPGVVESGSNVVGFEFPNTGDTRVGVLVNAQTRTRR